MVVILDILHTFHFSFFDDNHIPITTNLFLSAVVKVSGTIHLALLPSYFWQLQRSGFDK